MNFGMRHVFKEFNTNELSRKQVQLSHWPPTGATETCPGIGHDFRHHMEVKYGHHVQKRSPRQVACTTDSNTIHWIRRYIRFYVWLQAEDTIMPAALMVNRKRRNKKSRRYQKETFEETCRILQY